MAYDQIRNTDLAHNVIIEGRERLSISGVEDVESFDEESIIIYTSKGTLTVLGEGMRIEKLSVDQGELTVEGNIGALQYEDEVRRTGGFWHRLFR